MSLALAVLPLLASPAADDELAALLQAYLAPAVADGHVSGTVLLAHEGEVLFERAYGLANREHGVANRTDTRHGIASISKTLTLAMALRLFEAGTLQIGDSLATWLPDFPRAERITVEHLLRHRAGIPHRVTEEVEEVVPRTAADMVALASAALAEESAFLCEPGATSNYSSAGYSVLARVLELAAEKSYAELLEELVCAPAGMERTGHVDGRFVLEGRSQPYLVGARGFVNAPPKDLSFLVGAGSVHSTARDLWRFVEAVRGGVLGASVQASLLAGGTLSSNGATSGFRAFVDHDVATGITLAVTANVPTGALDRLRADLPRIAAGEDVPAPPRPEYAPVPVAAADLARWVGEYSIRPGQSFDVRVEGGELLIGSYVLIPTGDCRFFSVQDYTEVVARTDEEGRVTGLEWGATFMRRLER